jgi:hypothetical protein
MGYMLSTFMRRHSFGVSWSSGMARVVKCKHTSSKAWPGSPPPYSRLQLRSMYSYGTTRKSGTPTHPRASTIKLTVFCLPWRHQPPGIRGETVNLSKNYLNYTIMQYRGELIRLPTRGATIGEPQSWSSTRLMGSFLVFPSGRPTREMDASKSVVDASE